MIFCTSDSGRESDIDHMLHIVIFRRQVELLQMLHRISFVPFKDNYLLMSCRLLRHAQGGVQLMLLLRFASAFTFTSRTFLVFGLF